MTIVKRLSVLTDSSLVMDVELHDAYGHVVLHATSELAAHEMITELCHLFTKYTADDVGVVEAD